MKKIGILFGQEHSFPPAFVERVNQKTGGRDIVAEFVKIDKVIQGEPCGYDVVIDRISQDVPFYRAWLKNAALTGTAVVNNPYGGAFRSNRRPDVVAGVDPYLSTGDRRFTAAKHTDRRRRAVAETAPRRRAGSGGRGDAPRLSRSGGAAS